MPTVLIAQQPRAVGWFPLRYPLGEGLRAVVAERVVEVIPFVGEDGRGEVAGYAIRIDLGFGGFQRVGGSIESAIAVAEERIRGFRSAEEGGAT